MDVHSQEVPAVTAGSADTFIQGRVEYRRVELPGLELAWAVFVGADGDVLVDKHDGHGLKRPRQTLNESYRMVSLRRSDGGLVQPRVHQLVARAWLGPPPTPEHVVDHLDAVPSHNAVGNLRWASPKENRATRSRHMRRHRARTAGRVRRIPISMRTALEVQRITGLKGQRLSSWVEQSLKQRIRTK